MPSSSGKTDRITNRERGFTLIETIVALVLVMIIGVMFFQIVLKGTRAARIANSHDTALIVARSQLAEVGHVRPLAAGQYGGRTHADVRWEIVITPYAARAEFDEAFNPQAYWATVTVNWRDKREEKNHKLRLKTLKLGSAQ